MAILTRERLKPLLETTSAPCVSIYIPTHRHHPGTEQDPVRFKNALKEAARLLLDRHSLEETRELLDPITAIPNVQFWRHQADGLAILRSRDVLEEFRLPNRVSELVVVADSFHLRPLIRSLSANVRYILIALSQGGAEVFEGTVTSLDYLEIPGLPGSIAEFRAPRRRGPALSAHRAGAAPGHSRVHAAGGAASPERDDLVRYFRAIDRAVSRVVGREPVPVVLAGVEYYHPIYRSVSRLKNLAGAAAIGSPDAMTYAELHAKARPIAEAMLLDGEERALAQYRRATSRGRTIEALEAIVGEARRGRVRRLFLANGVRVWGTIDPQTGRVHRTEVQQGSHDDDVLDDIAEAVFQHGGDVMALQADRMPNGGEAAAELR